MLIGILLGTLASAFLVVELSLFYNNVLYAPKAASASGIARCLRQWRGCGL